MPGSNHSSKRAKWGMAAMGLLALVAVGQVALAATAEKAPPYLPLNVHVGEKAPDFALPSTDGKTVRLSQYLGHNVLLDFYEGYW
jgi:cytochrome oxidase Cu insertion factor (SCO1/SenC/PrrC family)